MNNESTYFIDHEAVFISAAKGPQIDEQKLESRRQTEPNQVGVTVEHNAPWH